VGRALVPRLARRLSGVGSDLVDAHFQHDQSNLLAFFPGYPALTSLVAQPAGATLVDAAFAVTVLSGLACSYGLVRLGTLLPGGSRRLGWCWPRCSPPRRWPSCCP